jgi:hypothetical protein
MDLEVETTLSVSLPTKKSTTKDLFHCIVLAEKICYEANFRGNIYDFVCFADDIVSNVRETLQQSGHGIKGRDIIIYRNHMDRLVASKILKSNEVQIQIPKEGKDRVKIVANGYEFVAMTVKLI